MDSLERLKLLSEPMRFEPDAEHTLVAPDFDRTERCPESAFIHPAVLPGGQRIKLLKTLLSSACERNCYYCPFRAGRDVRRATFQPEEFARLFMQLVSAGMAEGVFLSSGLVGGSVRTQDKLLETAEILRNKLGFQGYLHLKIMPGAERTQVERAMQLADRVSINLEAPNDLRLAKLAPRKIFFDELLQPLMWIEEIRRTQPPWKAWKGRWPSSVTQFVAGGAGESDLELLTTTRMLYQRLGVRRVYFSRFQPIPDTPLENQAPTSPIREHRLYQASFLLQEYGFEVEEFPFEADNNLPLDRDPKLAWAQKHLTAAPVEINRAGREQLLRVPGIGPKGADAILQARRTTRLRDLQTLKRLGILVERAAPFLLLDGRRATHQLSLF